jgi:hypothetical protein
MSKEKRLLYFYKSNQIGLIKGNLAAEKLVAGELEISEIEPSISQINWIVTLSP